MVCFQVAIVCSTGPGAEPQDGNLQEHTERLGQGIDEAGGVAGQRLQAEHLGVGRIPAPHHDAAHAHAVDHLGIAEAGIGRLLGEDRSRTGRLQRGGGQRIVGERQATEDCRAAEREQAEQRMKQ